MTVNESLWAQAERLAARAYEVHISHDSLSDGSIVVVVSHPELPGCMAHGSDMAEAMAQLREAATEYLYSLLQDGMAIPEPRSRESSNSRSSGGPAAVVSVIYLSGESGQMGSSVPDSSGSTIAYSGDFARND